VLVEPAVGQPLHAQRQARVTLRGAHADPRQLLEQGRQPRQEEQARGRARQHEAQHAARRRLERQHEAQHGQGRQQRVVEAPQRAGQAQRRARGTQPATVLHRAPGQQPAGRAQRRGQRERAHLEGRPGQRAAGGRQHGRQPARLAAQQAARQQAQQRHVQQAQQQREAAGRHVGAGTTAGPGLEPRAQREVVAGRVRIPGTRGRHQRRGRHGRHAHREALVQPQGAREPGQAHGQRQQPHEQHAKPGPRAQGVGQHAPRL